MNAPLSAAAHPYETRFSMEEIQRSIASIQDDKLIFLQVQSNEMGDVIVESMGEISVGLQKIIYGIEEFRSIEQCCVYTNKMISKFETLPNEILYDIFGYLSWDKILTLFWLLNKRINVLIYAIFSM
ncbi:unnamed protein product, partial [Rotaria socialis]